MFSQAAFSQVPTAEDLSFFERKVRPLLSERCLECHGPSDDQPKGGLRLDGREPVLAGGDNGPALVPGRPDESLLMLAIRYSDPDLEMPPDGKLSEREIAIFEEWIRRGAPLPASADDHRSEPKRIDISAGRQHWAFQPLSAPGDLPVADTAWPTNRIDLFIRLEQEKRGLRPSPAAEAAELFRRAKFDLVGLPPTFEELQEFIDDPSVDAFRWRLDRWLASPAYGERWARFWLELVRYCDIAEAWAETQGNSYLYRDWVVGALNDDVPYDRFAMLQIAADHMSEARPADLAALGFIGLSPTYWKELQLPVEIIKTIVSDEYEERIHTFSSTFLGLNVACARCHDHKNDPITVEDYYALAGVFASTRATDRALVAGVDARAIVEARQQEKKLAAEIKKLEAEIKKLSAAKLADTQKIASRQNDLDQLQQQLAQVRMTDGFDSLLAPGADDATLEVKEALGSHGSRVVYEPAPKDMAIEIRGNPNRPGAVVSRRFISVLSQGEPQPFTQGSGRLELAQAMLRQCQPLLARVLVNRIWKLHFGRGLVETPSDFGLQGDRPSHPELLDDLARRFIEHDWSIKWLHTEVMMSATYGQVCASKSAADPLNQFYTHAPLRRLDVEQWRDAMLAATGTLDNAVGGPPIVLDSSDNHRRTLYGTVKRRELSDVLRLYDFPDPVTHSPARTPTTTPLQQLFTLNSPFMLEQAAALVTRLEAEGPECDSQRVEWVYRTVLGRAPSEGERNLGLRFVSDEPEGSGCRTDVWKQYVQILLGSNEFYFID